MRPSAVLVILGLVQSAWSLVAVAFPEWNLVWWLPAALSSVPAVLDAGLALWQQAPNAVRSVSPVLIQGHEAVVALEWQNRPRGVTTVTVFDGVPSTFQPQGMPQKVRFQRLPGKFPSTEYRVIPTTRGFFEFEPAWLDVASPLRFWIRRRRTGQRQRVKVFPDLKRVLGPTLSMDAGHAGTGSHNVRRRGQGLEFHQLREYRQGDMIRLIDGKASSRLHKLVVREMQEEQDQTVLFLLDTGYRMTDTDGKEKHFDRVFEAVLALASTALRQGDRVGIRTWGPEERWIPPVRGRLAFPGLVERLFDVQASAQASSPAAALQDLLPQLNRRALIFLMTNFRDEDGEDIAPLVSLYRSRHLLCTVWLREQVVETLMNRVPTSLDEALETTMSVRYANERRRGRHLGEALGMLTLDVAPEHLRTELIRKYWQIKKRGLL